MWDSIYYGAIALLLLRLRRTLVVGEPGLSAMAATYCSNTVE
jgi:hypothetical protein